MFFNFALVGIYFRKKYLHYGIPNRARTLASGESIWFLTAPLVTIFSVNYDECMRKSSLVCMEAIGKQDNKR